MAGMALYKCWQSAVAGEYLPVDLVKQFIPCHRSAFVRLGCFSFCVALFEKFDGEALREVAQIERKRVLRRIAHVVEVDQVSRRVAKPQGIRAFRRAPVNFYNSAFAVLGEFELVCGVSSPARVRRRSRAVLRGCQRRHWRLLEQDEFLQFAVDRINLVCVWRAFKPPAAFGFYIISSRAYEAIEQDVMLRSGKLQPILDSVFCG